MLRRLLAENLKPDFVIIEVFPALLSKPGDASLIASEHVQASEVPFLRRYGSTVIEQPPLTLRKRLLALLEIRPPLVAALSSARLPDSLRARSGLDLDSHGWQEMFAPDATKRIQLTEAARNDFSTRFGPDLGNPAAPHWDFPGPACEAMKELLALCAEQHIRAALVLMPEGPLFRSWYTAQARRQTDEFIRQLSAEFHLPLLDARDWFSEEEFVDSHHLRGAGARAFTERLGRDSLTGWLKVERESRGEPRPPTR
jgi:hypothetical protein